MIKITLMFLLIIMSSCKTEKTENKKEIIKNITERKNEGVIIPEIPEIAEIGHIFKPEMMQQEEIKLKGGKSNYQYTIVKSDSLDTDLKNNKKNAERIAENYYKFLLRINKPLNFNEIIVKIVHQNDKIDTFYFPEKDFISKGVEFTINTKFIIKVTKIDEFNFKYSILKAEPYNKKLELWNTENLFEENGENETIEFYFAETENKNYMLLMQSRSKYSIKFKSEIQTEENEEFIEIQNVGTHKGAKTTESWAKKTYKIRLSKFELKK